MLFRSRCAFTSIVLFVILGSLSAVARAETIVFFRHGEKPAGGQGQLTCQGLNRALALPTILINRFGRPDYLYAPDPTAKIEDPDGSYYYVRPLATIEPTAIRAGKSVNTHYGYNEIGPLQALLVKRSKANATIFVSWEHAYLQKVVQNIMNAYGGGFTVPPWTSGDYDSLYVVDVDFSGNTPVATFHRESEGLNGLPTSCP